MAHPVRLNLKHLLHGGDYNPDQWLHAPEVLKEDLRLMELAHCNTMSLGIFGWAAYEAEEGKHDFEWLDRIFEDFAARGCSLILSTPSAGTPHWMARKYPEVLRVGSDRVRKLPGKRVSFCPTSPVYRRKVREINSLLAGRYKGHPSLLLWHVSNEYGGNDEMGACHCDLCQQAFRQWLREKYNDDLDALNRAWWNTFWSHTHTDWDQIESPAPHGEGSVHGLAIDWLRFVTHQTVGFLRNEMEPLRAITPDVPITTNLMGTFRGLDYWKFAPELDVISWDSYPRWHGSGDHPTRLEPRTELYGWTPEGADARLASDTGFLHDLNRSLKGGQPFLLMESTPSNTNWQQAGKLKRPGMHLLSSLQAVAHGSDSVLYFQWRKGRGGFEKFHGAVVDHAGHENTRVFRDVAETGKALEKLHEVAGATVEPEVAILFDWENRWAINEASGPRMDQRDYVKTCLDHYQPFWEQGVPVDVVSMDHDFSRHKILVAPMLYMLREGAAERIEAFVEAGGIFVTTYWSGIVDATDLCFMGGFPGPLRRLLGIWSEELDSLYPGETNHIASTPGNELGLEGTFEARLYCDLIHAETADVLAVYQEDFYAGRPALTRNRLGMGEAYYIASRNDDRFTGEFLRALTRRRGITPCLDTELPPGVTAQTRRHDGKEFVFLMNFTTESKRIALPGPSFTELLSGAPVTGELTLDPYGVAVLTGRQ